MEEEKQALGGLLVDTLNILLEFDPRWLDPKFGNQDERDYEFIDADAWVTWGRDALHSGQISGDRS